MAEKVIMMQRKGMMVGSGRKGYYNVIGKDPMVHSLSAKGIKQPQRMLPIGTRVKAKFTGARGRVISKQPFAVDYKYKSDRYVRFTDQKYWVKGGKANGNFAWSKDLGGKDMPVTEVEQMVAEKPKKSFNGTKLKKAAGEAYSFLKEKAKEGSEYLAERKATKKAMQLSSDVENKGLSTAYLAQKDRIHTIKEQIAERRAEGRNVDDLITELGKEERDYRELQEKISDVSTKAMSDGQLRELAVRTNDDSIFSLGGGNQYEKELLRRIAKRKEIQQKVEKAEKEPVKSGSLFDL